MDRNDSCEPEEHEIESVTSDSAANTTTIRLKETLQYTHEGKSINIPGAPIDKTVEQRAEGDASHEEHKRVRNRR